GTNRATRDVVSRRRQLRTAIRRRRRRRTRRAIHEHGRSRRTAERDSTESHDAGMGAYRRLETMSWTANLPRLAGTLVDVREVIASDAFALFELLSDACVVEYVSSPPP